MTVRSIIMTAVVAVIVAAIVIAALILYMRTHKRCGYCREREKCSRYRGSCEEDLSRK